MWWVDSEGVLIRCIDQIIGCVGRVCWKGVLVRSVNVVG